ncbi:sentrin-specific protease 1-like [Dermacentor silvarum]|uniref:sentrin-specific protease 1-like n=1 Tax=Dermacentor silvarum TaxID=543639 RepID=UPI0021012A2F|nr:sentrin-specific protease 1-like [Dermacentor silvarum]
MAGPSTGQNLSDLPKVAQDCSVVLQRLEDEMPDFNYRTWSTHSLATNEQLARAAGCTDGEDAAARMDYEAIKRRVLNELEDHQGEKHRVVVRSSAYTVTCTLLKTVLHRNWLNDVVIDFYMGLVAERAKEARDGLRVHALTTHFYNVLRKLGYAAFQPGRGPSCKNRPVNCSTPRFTMCE